MFVEMRAIELGQAVGVPGKMRGRPIDNHADAGLVAAIDKFHEFSGRSEAAGDGVVAKCLIAPGAIVGVLHDRQ